MKLLLISLSCLLAGALLPPKDIWEIFAPLENNLDYEEASKSYVSTPLFTKEMEELEHTIVTIRGYPYLKNQKDSKGKPIIQLSKKHLEPIDFYPHEAELIQIYSKESYVLKKGEAYIFQGQLHLNRTPIYTDAKNFHSDNGEAVDLPFQLKQATCLNCPKN